MLTDRQIELLEAIINEYLDTSEPVGSSSLVKKYRIKCSAATVRNEMARLFDQGFLNMLHTSSGRVPTSRAYRFFLEKLVHEDEMPVLQEVAIKQRLWSHRYNFEHLLREATLALADVTKMLVFATSENSYVVHAGAVHVLDYAEFWDIETAKSVFHLMDRYELLERVFNKIPHGGRVKVLIGDEIGNEHMSNCSVAFAGYQVGNRVGNIGIIGPSRMQYSSILPALKYTTSLVEELGGSW